MEAASHRMNSSVSNTFRLGAVLGFVGAPWTIATYIIEGGQLKTYSINNKKHMPQSTYFAKECSGVVGGQPQVQSEFRGCGVGGDARSQDFDGQRCIFLGYDTHKKGWRCMDQETKKVVVS